MDDIEGSGMFLLINPVVSELPRANHHKSSENNTVSPQTTLRLRISAKVNHERSKRKMTEGLIA